MSTSPPRTASQSQAIMTEPPANTASGIPSSSPLLPAPHAPNLAKSRRSRPNAATIRRTQQAQARAQRERDRARAVDAQTHQVAHPLEDYLEHIRFNEARLDRTRTGPGSHMPVVGAAADSATAVSLYYEEDPAALDFGLPVTVYDLAAAMVHDYCARHAASVGGVATAASAATSPDLINGGRGRKASAAASAAKRGKSPPLACTSPSSTSVVVVDPADVARTSAFLRKVVTIAGIASSSVLFAMMLVDRLRQISLPAAAAAHHHTVLSNDNLASEGNRRRSSRSRSRPRTGTATAAAAPSPRTPTSTGSTPSLGAYSALSLSALDESRPIPSPVVAAAPSASTRRKSTALDSTSTISDPPILFTPLYAPPLPSTSAGRPHSTTTTPPRSRHTTTADTAQPTLHTAASDPSLSTSVRKRSVTSSLPTLSLASPAVPTPTSPLTSPLLPLFPTLIHPSPITSRAWHPPPTLFITALMLADKSLFDSVYRTADWAIFTPYAPSDLVMWEHDLCAALAWDVAPPRSLDAWQDWVGRVQMALILGGRIRPRGADPSFFEVGVVVGRTMGAQGVGVGSWAQAAVQVVARSAAGVVGEEAAARAARVVGVVGVVVAWLAMVVGRLGGA